jgi:hypothetical protein
VVAIWEEEKMGRWVCTEKQNCRRGIMTDMEKRGIKWNRWKIRVSGRVGETIQKFEQVIATMGIREKRGIQWDRSQIGGLGEG